MLTYTPPDSIFDGLITNLLSILSLLIVLLRRGLKSLDGFKFDTFIGCFPSDKHGSERVKVQDAHTYAHAANRSIPISHAGLGGKIRWQRQ